MARRGFMRNDLSCLESTDGLPSQVRRGVSEVCRRTGCQAKWNKLRNTVHFYLTSPWFGVSEESLEHSWDSSVVDGIVRYIQSGRKQAAMKDIEVARLDAARIERSEREQAAREEVADREAQQRVRHELGKADMGKHWKGRAVVSGLKE